MSRTDDTWDFIESTWSIGIWAWEKVSFFRIFCLADAIHASVRRPVTACPAKVRGIKRKWIIGRSLAVRFWRGSGGCIECVETQNGFPELS